VTLCQKQRDLFSCFDTLVTDRHEVIAKAVVPCQNKIILKNFSVLF